MQLVAHKARALFSLGRPLYFILILTSSSNGAASMTTSPPQRKDQLIRCITQAFAPTYLELEDQSAHHQGHAGYKAGGQTHFRLLLVSSVFEGLSRLARQRLVYQAIAEHLQDGLHAIGITTLTPKEHQQRPK
jgi:stress-induced morphogen